VGPSEIDIHEPLSRVEVRTNGQWVPMFENGKPIDDDGYDLEVRYLSKLDEGMGEYEIRWYNPVPGGEYHFRIEPRCKHSALASRAFIYKGFADSQDSGAALVLTGDE
jgi:neutral ceramidase